MSMLDVLASALGAILILFVVARGEAADQRASLRQRDVQLERINAALARNQETLDARHDALAQARDHAAQAAEDAEQARRECPPAGLAVGMCEVEAENLTVRIFDHQRLDGDRVDLVFNRAPLRSDVLLGREAGAETIQLKLEEGANYLVAHALTEGTQAPNTATIVIDPCRGGRREAFEWDMKSGERRHISIVRRPRR